MFRINNGSRNFRLFLSLNVLWTCAALITGCAGTAPVANVSDIAVFASLPMLAAEVSSDAQGNSNGLPVMSTGGGFFTAAHMRRYFESTTRKYEPERMDSMLDGQQHQSASTFNC